jgi:O-6-methylguanine DNA methyltransferase
MKRTFTLGVYSIVRSIPKGKVATYQQIARLAGSPNAMRAVGTAMAKNPDMTTVPCHRVVGSDGRMHGYSAGHGVKTKIEMLKREGVLFNGAKVDLVKSLWNK